MTLQEFSELFDVHFNNIASNQAPGLSEYEKSVFLTKAQDEIIKNYFSSSSQGNSLKQGFDDSAKRQADFSTLMKTSVCSQVTVTSSVASVTSYICTSSGSSVVSDSITFSLGGEDYHPASALSSESVTYSEGVATATIGTDTGVVINNWPFAASGTITTIQRVVNFVDNRIDGRSSVFTFPTDAFIVINEALLINGKTFQVLPLRYDEYTRLMTKPYKRPCKNQAWRLINSSSTSTVGNVVSYSKYVELITTPEYDSTSKDYRIRYIRKPRPIIVGNLDGLTINGAEYNAANQCELDPILHEDILQRAIELAKIAWTATGNDNAQLVVQTGQRSE